MTKHTPGPWVVKNPFTTRCRVEGPVNEDDGTPPCIADMPQWTDEGDLWDERHRNAQLIAAAPELLAALKLAQPIIAVEQLHGRCDFSNQINDAISKAEGILA